MFNQTSFTLLALLFCAICGLGCGISMSSQSVAQLSPTPIMLAQSSPTAVMLTQPSPTPIMVAAHAISRPPSIEMRVIRSDAIVRVRQPSVTGKIQSIPSADEGVAPTYRPWIIFRFPVIEYLKGNGDDEIIVEWSFVGEWPREGKHTFLTREEAQDALTGGLAGRDTSLETRDSVLFLVAAQQNGGTSGAAATEYNFTRYASNEYALGENSKPWLPLAEFDSGASGQNDGEPMYLTDANVVTGNSELSTISLSDLRASVESVAAILEAGAGIEGYEGCVKQRLDIENAFVHDPPSSRPPVMDELPSGSPQRTMLPSMEGGWVMGLGYGKWSMEGRDAEYFQVHITDSPTAEEGYDIDYDESSLELASYYLIYTTKRPLPRGVYNFVPRPQLALWRLCGYNLPYEDLSQWEVTVVAPDGVLHEAFFDPVADGDAIAAGGSLGKLKPASFIADSVETTIQRVGWTSNKIAIRLANPPVSLADHHIDFIALDGSAHLRLDFDAAAVAEADGARALSWDVCVQPWRPGDLLMLRMAKTADDAGGSATYGTGCEEGASATATP